MRPARLYKPRERLPDFFPHYSIILEGWSHERPRTRLRRSQSSAQDRWGSPQLRMRSSGDLRRWFSKQAPRSAMPCGSGPMFECSRPGNTTSTALPNTCSPLSAGIHRTRKLAPQGPSLLSAISNRWQRGRRSRSTFIPRATSRRSAGSDMTRSEQKAANRPSSNSVTKTAPDQKPFAPMR